MQNNGYILCGCGAAYFWGCAVFHFPAKFHFPANEKTLCEDEHGRDREKVAAQPRPVIYKSNKMPLFKNIFYTGLSNWRKVPIILTYEDMI